MEGMIHIDDLMNHMLAKNLVIARRDRVMSDEQVAREVLREQQLRLLDKKWVSYAAIIRYKLLGYSSRSGLVSALKKRADFDLVVQKINGKYCVLTSAIKEMRDGR